MLHCIAEMLGRAERRECALQDIKFNVHAHPTLSEVLDELFKGAHVENGKPAKAPAALDSAKMPVAA